MLSTTWRKILILVLGLFLTTPAVLTETAVTLRVSPQVQYAPRTVILQSRILPNIKNRILCLIVEGDTGYYRSSCITLDAKQAPITHRLRYGGLPEGQYTASAELKDNSRVLAHVSHPFQVL